MDWDALHFRNLARSVEANLLDDRIGNTFVSAARQKAFGGVGPGHRSAEPKRLPRHVRTEKPSLEPAFEDRA
jgi:hypothetical protein